MLCVCFLGRKSLFLWHLPERDEYMHFTSCKSVVASPPIKKEGLTLDWDKMCSENGSLTSINLCVQILVL